MQKILFFLFFIFLAGCETTNHTGNQTVRNTRNDRVEILPINLMVTTSHSLYGAKRVVTLEFRNLNSKYAITFQVIDWEDDGLTDYIHHQEIKEMNIITHLDFYRGRGLMPFIEKYLAGTGQKIQDEAELNSFNDLETGITITNPYLLSKSNSFRYMSLSDYRLDAIFRQCDKLLAFSQTEHKIMDSDECMEIVLDLSRRRIIDYPESWRPLK